MATFTKACARCTAVNHGASRFCTGCGLPLGAAEADPGAWVDVLGSYEVSEPADPDQSRLVRDFVGRAGYEARPSGSHWQIDVLLPMGRKQAVYLGDAGVGGGGAGAGAIVSLVSISGTANDRDPRILLKLNARTVEGHFAIKVLRGEEYFVVVRNLPAQSLAAADARHLVTRIAETADTLEDRLSRGRDLF